MGGVAELEALHRLVDATVGIGADLDLPKVLQRVLDAAVDLSDARYGALAVIDEAGKGFAQMFTVGFTDDQIAAIGTGPEGLGLLGRVIETKEPLRVAVLSEHPGSVGFPPNHPPMKSFLGVPIRVRDEVFGNLYLADKQSGEVFTDIDEALVGKLAVAAGVAIEHARLFEAVAYRQKVIGVLDNVARALLAGVVRDDVLQMIAASARELLGGALASIVIPGEDGEAYVPAIDGRLGDAYRGRKVPVGAVAKRVLKTRAAGSLDSLAADPDVGYMMSDLGPVLFAPIVLEEPQGCLVVCRVAGDAAFVQADLELLEILAGQVRFVLEHDRRRMREKLQARSEDQLRIAEKLGRSALQEIFGASRVLSAAAGITDKAEVRDRINEAIEALDRAITLARQAIFDLKTTT